MASSNEIQIMSRLANVGSHSLVATRYGFFAKYVLERLAEAAEAAELVDDERYALTQLVRLAPDEQRYLDD
jgi:hypothetical protein